MNKWEYKVKLSLGLPPPEHRRNHIPMADRQDVEYQLNQMGEQGWELVTYGEKKWFGSDAQSYWIFRRPKAPI